jgi:hypothetical protein
MKKRHLSCRTRWHRVKDIRNRSHSRRPSCKEVSMSCYCYSLSPVMLPPRHVPIMNPRETVSSSRKRDSHRKRQNHNEPAPVLRARLLGRRAPGRWFSTPFPNKELNDRQSHSDLTLDSVLGIRTDVNGVVWMLDDGMRSGVTPKLVGWDTKANKLHRVIYFRPQGRLRQ